MQRGNARPHRQGLYDPAHERDACGVGFVAHLKGEKSHDLIGKGLSVLANLRTGVRRARTTIPAPASPPPPTTASSSPARPCRRAPAVRTPGWSRSMPRARW